VLATVANLKSLGVLEAGCDQETAAELVADCLADNHTKVADAVGADWDAIIALILKLLPIILALFGL
jgi:hypothetical protein